MSDDKRVEELEVKLAFMEKLVQELDEVVRELANQVDVVRDDVGTLRAQVMSDSEHKPSATDQEPPPHY